MRVRTVSALPTVQTISIKMGMLDLLITNTTVLLPAPTLSSWKTQGVHVDTPVHMVLLPLFAVSSIRLPSSSWPDGCQAPSLAEYEKQYRVNGRSLSSVIWLI